MSEFLDTFDNEGEPTLQQAPEFSGATGLFLEPGRNKAKKTRVPVETAVLRAQSLGLVGEG